VQIKGSGAALIQRAKLAQVAVNHMLLIVLLNALIKLQIPHPITIVDALVVKSQMMIIMDELLVLENRVVQLARHVKK
jgi:hypothetical protein